MAEQWLVRLREHVRRRPIVVLQFAEAEWQRLQESRRGLNRFTTARRHDALEKVRPPTICLINPDGAELYLGIVTSRRPVTTLDSRIVITRCHRIARGTVVPKTVSERLSAREPVQMLGQQASVRLLDALLAVPPNDAIIRTLAAILDTPARYSGALEMQEDAVRVAMRAFGLAKGEPADWTELERGSDSALARVPIHEDEVVQQDARSVPGFQLVESDITGRSVFRRGGEQLEIITANRTLLERALGVDLIYLNKTKQNVVMVQYKMLEREGHSEDWIFRPDGQFDTEMKRMKLFATRERGGPSDYRINTNVCYLKFVRRDAQLGRSGSIMPVDHFEALRADPKHTGPRGGFRISYQSLDGRYLREAGFLDLIRSGYIGAHAETTAHLATLIRELLRGNRALVVAVQSAIDHDATLRESDGD